ncbi:hypothetical protein [Lysinibacillus odysseyi]|uniref:Siderophore biosynthesis protein n=1 Tax=Lysinibacillus odysseyi 34hs-1 = NBRC 100172 TaxID=1220589 RepID=A0A0A3IN66_9BACI|nr:hypothetical protein [Lysinibacillus odysseyi]KGR84900.1 siderophore biosynthesis protein [Lysinibacillus odysseyi 34hs-1 = NBRC 100172]
MNIPEQFIKPFPSYEEVFYDELEQHKKYFLPICSINLQCVDPEWDEWLHIVSVKEIHDGCVGENTKEFHTRFTTEDTLGFNIIDGKYQFEAGWDYFEAETDGVLEDVYLQNETDYEARKQFFLRHGKIYPYSSFGRGFESAEALEQDFNDKQAAGWGLEYPMVNGILDDVRFITEEGQVLLEDYESEADAFDYTNLLYVPKDENGAVFTYIGFATGYYFQACGADRIYLFFNKELKKAVICLEYT